MTPAHVIALETWNAAVEAFRLSDSAVDSVTLARSARIASDEWLRAAAHAPTPCGAGPLATEGPLAVAFGN